MTRTCAALLSILLVLLVSAPAAAQGVTSETEMVAYENKRTQTIYIAAEMDGETPEAAQLIIFMIDDEFVEENFGGEVFASETLNEVALLDIGADSGSMYGIMKDGNAVIFTIVSKGSSIFMFAMTSKNDLDTDEATKWIFNVLALGLDAPPPQGFTEIESEDADFPF